MTKLSNVFVYGTLMRGERNHEKLDGARLVSERATTAARHYLMHMFNSSSSKGKYSPAVKQYYAEMAGAGKIEGEVYEVNEAQLVQLDELEQNGVRYKREKVSLEGDLNSAYMYLFIGNDTSVSSKENEHIMMSEDSGVISYRWREVPAEPKL